MRLEGYRVRTGTWDNAGATVVEGGVNFCVFSRYTETMELLLFERDDSIAPATIIRLDPEINRTFFFWHILVEDLPDGIYYNWRADGRCETRETGCRIDGEKALLDPWATTVSNRLWNREAACRPGNNLATAMRAQVVRDDYDWEGDQTLYIPLNDAIVYEMHVGGFTSHPSSGVTHPGTFAGVIEKIPYLRDLGITHVELMPVMAFDHQDVPPATARLGLENYWGYSTHSFFAPHPSFTVTPSRARDEFRDMVKAFHRAGIGVILDVVFNHTAEGGEDGPTISFKALGNEMFYHLDFEDRRRYRDYTGCGNTVNCNHPMVTRFLVDALLYWVRRMHVDGFRFDLASALARGEDGNPQYHAPVLWATELSPSLSRAHIIAEAWDAAGLYQVGDFPGYRWAEWNGRYRDVIRGFVRGDPGLVPEVATRLTGSSDMYGSRGRLPLNSINFVTCHDGFTLHDLVSYDEKHNAANGEDNRDGSDHNISWNCGQEGPTDDPAILTLRQRQARNFVSLLMLSQGVPMLLSGDEVMRSKLGNNNSYCQNNELSWSDWELVETNRDMLDFVRAMIALRRRHPTLTRNRFLTGKPANRQTLPDITWHGVGLETPNWDDPDNRALAFTLAGIDADEPPLHIMMNMGLAALEFALPSIKGLRWCLAVDTACEPSVVAPDDQRPLPTGRITLGSRSVIVLEARDRA
ncbi:glycogen debranching protein GlgX [Thiocystis violascens]|uniref:Pullulanase-like glycosidase possibly secreted by type II secretory pathway n=1 Tax=Thiocystis violascens (strain ATCC 17096 / DSM 198 / 6111) TaxID=765911 RepID=I3YHE9_THIV6|nr:glycogen debranching protein GlgX [Thiocystis violascens]AFL76417.1 pullulanase-like glycosidase possibly secreted by type II secretory pathway [Thiocystis violascens DSM 198]